jgi:hypothetical protein
MMRLFLLYLTLSNDTNWIISGTGRAANEVSTTRLRAVQRSRHCANDTESAGTPRGPSQTQIGAVSDRTPPPVHSGVADHP